MVKNDRLTGLGTLITFAPVSRNEANRHLKVDRMPHGILVSPVWSIGIRKVLLLRRVDMPLFIAAPAAIVQVGF